MMENNINYQYQTKNSIKIVSALNSFYEYVCLFKSESVFPRLLGLLEFYELLKFELNLNWTPPLTQGVGSETNLFTYINTYHTSI